MSFLPATPFLFFFDVIKFCGILRMFYMGNLSIKIHLDTLQKERDEENNKRRNEKATIIESIDFIFLYLSFFWMHLCISNWTSIWCWYNAFAYTASLSLSLNYFVSAKTFLEIPNEILRTFLHYHTYFARELKSNIISIFMHICMYNCVYN